MLEGSEEFSIAEIDKVERSQQGVRIGLWGKYLMEAREITTV